MISKTAITLVKLYQIIVSPLLGNNCRHEPQLFSLYDSSNSGIGILKRNLFRNEKNV